MKVTVFEDARVELEMTLHEAAFVSAVLGHSCSASNPYGKLAEELYYLLSDADPCVIAKCRAITAMFDKHLLYRRWERDQRTLPVTATALVDNNTLTVELSEQEAAIVALHLGCISLFKVKPLCSEISAAYHVIVDGSAAVKREVERLHAEELESKCITWTEKA